MEPTPTPFSPLTSNNRYSASYNYNTAPIHNYTPRNNHNNRVSFGGDANESYNRGWRNSVTLNNSNNNINSSSEDSPLLLENAKV